jgi:zinc transporter
MTSALDAATGLLHAFVLDGQGGAEELDWDGVERWRPDHGVLWINLDYAAPDAEQWLGMRAGLDPVVREALLDPDPRPRALPLGDNLLFIARTINVNQGAQPEDMVSLRCWVEARRVVSMRHRTVQISKTIAADLRAGKGPRTSGDLLIELADRLVDRVVDAVDALDDAVARLEDAAIGRHQRAERHQVAELRRQAIRLRRFIHPQREAFTRLTSTNLSWLGDGERAKLREIGDRQTRTVEELDAARERAMVTHEEMSSRQADVSNQRLYVLSIMAAVFMPLGFITSLLGVNVGGIPGTTVAWGFWALVALIALAFAGQLWILRKLGWL